MSLSSFGRRLDGLAHRYMPDPFVLAVLLTAVVSILGILLGTAFEPDASYLDRVQTTLGAWKSFVFEPKLSDGSTNKGLLYFAFQMCLMLVTGHALASSPPVSRIVRRIARLSRDARTGASITALVGCGMALVHWGLGLIVGAMIAREVGSSLQRRGIPHHYPLIGAAGYTGLMVWGTGLSGSIPLAAAGQRDIALDLTIFSTTNIIIVSTLFILIPIIAALLVPSVAEYRPFPLGPDSESARDHDTTPQSPRWFWLISIIAFGATLSAMWSHLASAKYVAYVLIDGALVAMVTHRILEVTLGYANTGSPKDTPAQRLENHPIIVLVPVLMGLGWLQFEVLQNEFKLSFNNLNFAFLFLGVLFQGSLPRYVSAVSDGAKGCAGIILQFPFYFGILGVMLATGLGDVIAANLASIANETTYPVITYLSAGLVNLIVPSGGGQWVVQGAIVLDGAAAFPEVIPRAILALALGDAWTNMLQPFWAVPLLAITGLRARDIIGYTGAIMLVAGGVTMGLLALI